MNTPNEDLQLLARRLRRWQAAPPDLNGSATDPTWTLVDLLVEFLKRAPVVDIMALLIARPDFKKNELYGSFITLAAEHDLSHLILPLAAAGLEVNIPGKEGMTAIDQAISNGSTQKNALTVKALLEVGATSHDGGSLLMYAAYCGHPHNVQALLDAGADPNAACPVSRETPLMTALLNLDVGPRMTQTVRLLLEGGADPNLPQTLLNYDSKLKRNIENTELPINALARNPASELSDGELAEILNFMIDKGLKIDHDRHDLHHPLSLCLRHNNDRLAHLLLQHGANVQHVNYYYKDGFSLADLNALTAGSPNQRIATITPFQLFARADMPQTTGYLLEHTHEDPDQLLWDGTPLVQTVFHPETKALFLSAITQKQIQRAMDAPDSSDAPAKPRRNLSL